MVDRMRQYVQVVLVIGLLTIVQAEVYSRGTKNKIESLPTWDKPIPFNMYSGFLRASEKHYLHYWFIESQSAPATDPVVVWLNGGPGCSSLSGFLEELGPFLMNDDATLKWNEWAWNRQANMIFLESPAGVGFSYSADFQVNTNDNSTADHNYVALRQFFYLFPQFSRHDLYITGESYGGIYVPTLAYRIVEGNKKLPREEQLQLKGIAIGNGMVDDDINTDTMMEFGYSHGLIDEKEWQYMLKLCCDGQQQMCDFANTPLPACQLWTNITQIKMWLGGLNPYDLYRDCWEDETMAGKQKMVSERYMVNLMWMAPPAVRDAVNPDGLDNDEVTVVVNPTCSNQTAVTVYLNRPDVRQALLIPDFVGDWSTCRARVKWDYEKTENSMFPYMKAIVAGGVKVMLYSGDTDMACNYMMGKKFSQKMGLPLIHSGEKWTYADNQIGGFITRYEGLDFVTLKGAGHMAPGWRPEQNFKVYNNWIHGLPIVDKKSL